MPARWIRWIGAQREHVVLERFDAQPARTRLRGAVGVGRDHELVAREVPGDAVSRIAPEQPDAAVRTQVEARDGFAAVASLAQPRARELRLHARGRVAIGAPARGEHEESERDERGNGRHAHSLYSAPSGRCETARRLPTTLALALLAIGCAPGSRSPATRFAAAGDYTLEIARPEGERSFIVHLPPDYAARAPLPVLFAFHGGGGNAPGFKKYAGLDAPADARGFAVVYPNGSGRFAPKLLTWNAGECCGFAAEHDIDDVGFALAILADLSRDLPLDRARVYATGHSNGGMMAYRLAADAATHIAAIAPVAGADMTRNFAPAAPVAVLHVHSVDDPRALYAGGLGPPFPLTNKRVLHRAVDAGLARWRARDGCTGTDRETDARSVGGHTAILFDYPPCSSGYDVAHWKLTGAGHGWPGSGSVLPERIVGPHTEVIDVADEILAFVARYAR